MPPIKFGIKNTVRKSDVPRNLRVNANAKKNAITLISKTETTVKAQVNIKEREKEASPNDDI